MTEVDHGLDEQAYRVAQTWSLASVKRGLAK